MSEVGPDSVLYQYRRPDQVLLVGADAQEQAYVPLAAVELLAVEERAALRTAGRPLWLGPEPVRDELRVLQTRVVAAADRDAVERALDLVEYACSTSTGVAVVPPADSAAAARHRVSGQSDPMHECCFCDSPLDSTQHESLGLTVSAAARVADEGAPSQKLWCHARCLGDRLRPAVPFEPTAFDD